MSGLYTPRVNLVGPGGDHTDPLQQNYKLYLYRKMMDGYIEVINGNKKNTITEGTVQPEPSLTIPPEYIGGIIEALLKDQGRGIPNDAATLTEALTIERARVNDVLQHFMGRDD